MTLVCVPIMVEEPDAALTDALAARDAAANLVEFRVDTYFTGEGAEQQGGENERRTLEILRLVAESPLPCIVTCRPVLEGGHYDGPEAARIALFERLGTAGGPGQKPGSGFRPPRYLDVELATYTRSANIKQKINLAIDHPEQIRDVSTSLILSSHDFHGRPPDLIRRLERMYSEPACRVVKVAFRARSLRDNLELLDILAANRSGEGGGKPIIALAMGPFGLMSRVLAPKFGAFLTFASLRRDSATAPGQPIISELLGLYRFRSIGSATGVYGVVGYPVEHSLSPAVHNAGFEAVGHDGVYLRLPIPPEYEHFKASMLAMIDHAHLDLRGVSVTMPHKEHLVRLAREEWEAGDGRWSQDILSQRCGSANTLVIQRSPKGEATKLTVANTDGPAAADLLADATTILVLGVGGTARAVATELLHRGKRVLLWNRNIDTARDLAERLATATALPAPLVVTLEEAATHQIDALINTTPVGMDDGPAPGQSPITQEQLRNLRSLRVVADCVYRPARTPLLQAAEAAGLRTIDGLAMFVSQAAEQFRLWTGQAAPRQLFDRIAREA